MKQETIEKLEEQKGEDAGFGLHKEGDYRKPWRIFRIMSEFVEGYQFLSSLENQVTILGSARTEESNEYYKTARELGQLLAKNDYTTITGGGPGIMEAANRGAHDEDGESVGLNIQLPFEQRVNPYVKKAMGFYYFFTRKVMLTSPADAFVFFPGGFGTMDEFFEVIDNIELGKMCRVPIVLIGSDYWQPLIDFLKESGCELGSVSEEQVDKWHLVDSAEEAYEVIEDYGELDTTCDLSALNFTSGSNVNWRIFRIMSELVEGFEFISGLKDDISVLGTKSIERGTKYYKSAYRLGQKLAERSFATITGGAPGIGEAVNKGAQEKGGDSIGIGMKVRGETRINEYVNKSIIFDFPFTRKVIMTAPSGAFIFYPGGFGTMHELFEVLTLIQTGKIDRHPVILYDHDFWEPWHVFIKKVLDHEDHTISPTDDELYQIVDSEDSIMNIIDNNV